MKFVAICRK